MVDIDGSDKNTNFPNSTCANDAYCFALKLAFSTACLRSSFINSSVFSLSNEMLFILIAFSPTFVTSSITVPVDSILRIFTDIELFTL